MGSVEETLSARFALMLSFAHFAGMVTVLCVYPEKPFIFTYTTCESYHDIMRVFNYSNVTLFFQTSGVQTNGISGGMAQHNHNLEFSLNPLHSTISVSLVSLFALFMTGSALALLYAFATIRIMETGQINCNSQYGEHGVLETMGWESIFWIFVCVQHVIVLTVMSSPGDTIYTVFQSSAITVLLCLFCCIGSNIAADNPAKRFEAPVLILLCMCYVLFLSNSKVVVSLHTTYVIWLIYLALDGLLAIGHTWDFPVSCQTVVNCRWTYTVLCCWANVALYLVL